MEEVENWLVWKWEKTDAVTTWIKKKRRTYLLIDKTDKKIILAIFKKDSLKDFFKKSFILDQSQICISNGLGARALQREALFC